MGIESQNNVLSTNFSNFFMHIPSTSMITLKHKKSYTVEVILDCFKRCMTDAAPARCVLVLSRSDQQKFINMTLSLGGKIFLELKRNQSCLQRMYQFKEKPTTNLISDDIVCILIQNDGAESSFPFSFQDIKKQIFEWGSMHGVQDLVVSPINSSL